MSNFDFYSILIRWSEEDGEYVATCAEFPGLSAFGSSRAEALAEAEGVLVSFVEIAKEHNALPRPDVVAV